ncbi:MAG: amidohydrolase family protein [Pseudomonadota bacterium]
MKTALQTVAVLAVAAAAALCLSSCAQPSAEVVVVQGLVIGNVNVVGTRDGSLRRGVNVVIDDGRIQAVTASPVRVSGSAQRVDGDGKYLVPGFLDMHTHAAPTLASTPNDFPVLLANGVTGIREASGSPPLIAAVRRHNAAVQAGTFAGPEVLMMPSMLYAGQAPTEEGARQFVRDRLAEGADFIKIVGGPPSAFLAAIDEARKQGSHAAGHMSPAVSAVQTSNAGYRSIEHLGSGMGLLLDCSGDEAAIRAAALAARVPPPAQVVNPRVADGQAHAALYQRIVDTYDADKCGRLAQVFAKNGTWQAVTLIRLRTQAFGSDAAYRQDPNLQYVDKARVALWNQTADQYAAAVPAPAQASLQAFYGLQRRTVKLLQEGGVKILAGSDLGGGWVVPGFSLHQEFAELSAAGLSPLQVLQAATLSGAQFAGRESTLGTVEAGKHADLVLLDANPLEDARHLDRIAAVVLRGRHFPRAALDRMLAEVAARYAAQAPRPLAALDDPSHPPHH